MAAAWLMTTVLLWGHGPVQYANAIVVGLLVLLLLPLSYVYPKLRYGVAGAGYWLAFSSLTVFFATDSLLTAGVHIATGTVIFTSAIGPFSGITVVPARATSTTAPREITSEVTAKAA
jgi:hypothetical protein